MGSSGRRKGLCWSAKVNPKGDDVGQLAGIEAGAIEGQGGYYQSCINKVYDIVWRDSGIHREFGWRIQYPGQINGMSTDIERVPEKAVLGLVLIAIPHSGMCPTDWVRNILVG